MPNKDNIIEIKSISELQKIGIKYPLDGYFVFTSDIDAWSCRSWNGKHGFLPIGSTRSPFVGVLDGNGFSIKGLLINKGDTSNIGLFSCIGKNGIVKNIVFEDSWIDGENNVGTISGTNFGMIENCSVRGSVTGKIKNVGGLVGKNLGIISNSSFKGPVNGDENVGGIAGVNLKGIIKNCSFVGVVVGVFDVGEIVKHNEGIVKGCESKAQLYIGS